MSTSGFWADISAHYEMFEPDAYICIAEYADSQVMSQIKRLKSNVMFCSVPIIMVTNEDCYEFYTNENEYEHTVDIILSRPISIAVICDKITALLRSIEEEKERIAKEAEEAERIARETEEAERIAREAEAAKVESLPKEASAHKRKHIVVVDDDKNILKLLKAALEDKYDVTSMASGKMALRFLETKTPNLIFLDYEMPVENGPTIFRKIKKIESAKDIPVVFLTGIAEREKITEVLSLKPQGYLLKPINIERVNETIKSMLG
ncbi:MAG: response regulator [Oscillospiraceae bacterium]|nr:response regulator [Oscillospiraceae bacterium]